MEALENWHDLLSRPRSQKVEPQRPVPVLIGTFASLMLVIVGLEATVVFQEALGTTPFLLVWVFTTLNFLIFGTLPGYISGLTGILLTQYFVINNHQLRLGSPEILQIAVFMCTYAFINQLILRQRHSELTMVNDFNRKLLERLDVLRTVTDSMPVFVWICDPDKKCTYFNRAWTDFTGRTLAEELGFGWIDRIHPDDTQGCVNAYKRAFTIRSKFSHEFRVRRKDGEYRWILDEGVPLFSPSGQFVGYVGSCTDITERKTEENRLQAVLTNMPVMLSVYDENENRIIWNKECERVTGYSAEEICYNPKHLELLYPDPEYRAELMAQRKAYGGEFRDWELKTTCKDGSVRYILWTNVSKTFPIPQWADWAVGIDVTERWLIEDALRQSESNFSVALKNSPISVSHIDTDLRYRWVYNLPPSVQFDLLGKRDEEVWSGDMMKNLIQFKKDVLASGKGDRREIEFVDPAGYMVYDVTAEPIFDDDGTITGLTLASLDITSRKLFEQQQADLLKKQTEVAEQERIAREKAEAADRLKLDFLAMISHELRTPLTAIKGFATTLLADDVVWDTASQQEFLSIISQDSDRLTDLIEQLLDLSRLEAGRFSIQLSTFQLSECLPPIMAQLEMLTHKHELKVAVPNNLAPVLADCKRTGQVVANLVDNAAKYAPPGTIITLTACQIEDHVQVEVTDQGPGIPLEQRSIVFETFRQLESKFAHTGKGAGLGLAICKRLVEAQGGEIWVADSDGIGTKMVFTIPLAREAIQLEG